MNKWSDDRATSKDYKEALAIITLGKSRLAAQGRGEEENFEPVAAVEVDQEKRYEYFQQRAKATRDAKQEGKKLNDLDVDKIVGATWRVD